MFALSRADLATSILGCADGPASFNAEQFERGGRVVSVDPLYRFRAVEIAARIEATKATIIEQTRANLDSYAWNRFRTVEALENARLSAMERFIEDFSSSSRSGHYVAAQLPGLPFADGAFDLAVCSHFLFLYSEQHDRRFHLLALAELCRVASEVRVFPLLSLDGSVSCHLEPTLAALRRGGMSARVEQVAYEFQRDGNRMLRVRRH